LFWLAILLSYSPSSGKARLKTARLLARSRKRGEPLGA